METSEFHTHFSQETGVILRRRLIWFIAIWGGLGALGFIATLILAFSGASFSSVISSGPETVIVIVTSAVWVLCYIAALVLVVERKVSADKVIQISMALIFVDGLTAVIMRASDISIPTPMNMSYFVFAHLVACCVFPWTVRQATVPLGAVLLVSTLSHWLVEPTSLQGSIIWAIVALCFSLPALFIAAFRHNQRMQRSTNRFLSSRYGKLRQELAYARQVHEALFPAPRTSGSVRFMYRYEPMRQIGGDYLHTQFIESKDGSPESFSAVLVDVTGHGIPAALTVNRLHGEIDLRFAEQPDIAPGHLLKLLNRYINLTLSKHSIFATAMCIQVLPEENLIRYASGGHPPAFIRGVDGTVRDLEPTTFVLGATGDHGFDPGEREIAFHPGDSMIAYTDGATEARSVDGSMLRVEGLRRIIAAAHMLGGEDHNQLQGRWPERILREVTTHRGGLPTEDDTLAIEIYRPINVDDPSLDIGTRSETLISS